MIYPFLVSFVLVGGILTVLTVQNLANSVQLVLFGWQTPGIPPGLLIFLSFLLGALLLYLVAVIAARHDRQRIKKLREQVSGLEQEMTRLQQQHQQIVAQLQLQQQNMMPPQSRSLIMKMPRMSGPLQN